MPGFLHVGENTHNGNLFFSHKPLNVSDKCKSKIVLVFTNRHASLLMLFGAFTKVVD